MKRLENATHFVELAADGKNVTVRTGRRGTKERVETKPFHNKAVASRNLDKLAAAYAADGYRVVHPPIPTHPRNAELEAAIRANRADPAAYAVYADWLQGQGSPVGELIILDQAKQTVLADKLRATVGVPDRDVATLAWRWGLWRSLRLDNASFAEEFDALAHARDLFSSMLCGVLEELRLGLLRWDHDVELVPAVLAAAASHPWARHLRSLHVGDCARNVDMAHHAIGDVGAVVSRAFPALVELRLRSGVDNRQPRETFGLTRLALPALETLVVETCSLSGARLMALLGAKLPALRRLELWFGAAARGADAGLEGLAPLLSGARHAGVTVLGLRNTELTDVLAGALGECAIAGRLERLDLSMGTLGDAGARALVAARDRFARLDELVVDDNFLTAAGLAALTAAFPHVISREQKTPYDGDERYVTVGE